MEGILRWDRKEEEEGSSVESAHSRSISKMGHANSPFIPLNRTDVGVLTPSHSPTQLRHPCTHPHIHVPLIT